MRKQLEVTSLQYRIATFLTNDGVSSTGIPSNDVYTCARVLLKTAADFEITRLRYFNVSCYALPFS